MKPFLGVLLACLSFLPVAARSEPVGVRSGDHDGFSRILIQFAERETWVVGRVDGGFEFRPARTEITYRLGRVFDKIGRSRIEDVQDRGDGRLFLAVNCDCHAVVDELDDGQVVLDIVRGEARAPGTGVNASLPSFTAKSAGQQETAPDNPPEPPNAVVAPRAPVEVSDRGGLPLTPTLLGPSLWTQGGAPRAAPTDPAVAPVAMPPHGAPAPESHDTSQTTEPTISDPPDRTARLAQTETALLEQVARAAAQGLLDADMGAIEESVADAVPDPIAPPPPPPAEPPASPVVDRGHITVETSVDRAVSSGGPRDGETDEGAICIDAAHFAIETWGGEIENGTDIGAYRSGLVGEFDDADGAGVTALARNYVYITFGAEAKALIRRFPQGVERPDLLFALAEIMDEGWSQSAQDLADQMTCDGATALWATLAQPELRPGQPINRDAITLAFGALPAHLRRHLGPGLADKLLTQGDTETAGLIRSATDRAGGLPGSDYNLVEAKIDLESGRVEQATATLDEVMASGDAALPEAVLKRVEATLASGGAVPEDIVVLLDGLAFQFRGTETARSMTDAGIRARSSSGDFTGALEQLDKAQSNGELPPAQASGLREGLFERLTQDTDSTQFLRLSLPRLDEAASLSTAVRHAFAQRLLDLGFAGPARQALGRGETMPGPEDRRLLARAALLERKPAVAIGYLAGLEDAHSLSLRAEALEMARDHPGAMRAYEESGDQAKMLRMAWQGGLWADAATLDEGAIGTAAGLMADPKTSIDPAAETDIGLAAAQALIAESEAARGALNALLDELRSPADEVSPGPEAGL